MIVVTGSRNVGVRRFEDDAQPYIIFNYLVDLAGAKQSEIRVASRSVTYDALGEHYRLTLLNHSLAGSFNSRINLNLREDKGYSYGAFAYLRANETTGCYVVQTSVRNDVTAAAIEEIFKEIHGIHSEGITDSATVSVTTSRGGGTASS